MTANRQKTVRLSAARAGIAGTTLLTALALASGLAQAQIQSPLGPPIPPHEVFRQNAAPVPVAPPAPSAPQRSTSGNIGAQPALPRGDAPVASRRNRARNCQHQATVDGVSGRRRTNYIQSCMQD